MLKTTLGMDVEGGLEINMVGLLRCNKFRKSNKKNCIVRKVNKK